MTRTPAEQQSAMRSIEGLIRTAVDLLHDARGIAEDADFPAHAKGLEAQIENIERTFLLKREAVRRR